jgi:hypothetical protein
MVSEATRAPKAVMEAFENTDSDDAYNYDFKIAFNTGVGYSGTTFLRQLTHTMQEKLNVETKMVNADHFSNGITVYSFFLNVEPEILPNLKRYCSLCFSIPPKALYNMFLSGDLSGRELLYLNSACRFAYYFLTNENENFDALFDHFKHDPSNQARLAELGSSLGSEEVPISNTYGAVTRNLEVRQRFIILVYSV